MQSVVHEPPVYPVKCLLGFQGDQAHNSNPPPPPDSRVKEFKVFFFIFLLSFFFFLKPFLWGCIKSLLFFFLLNVPIFYIIVILKLN
mgnify:CR=1 FL=1